MKWETFKFIVQNKERFLFDAADGSGNDTTTDPGADKVNVNAYLSPVIGGVNIVTLVVFVAAVLAIIFFIKNFKQWKQ